MTRDITSRMGSIEVVPYDNRFEQQVLELARMMHAESTVHRDIPMDEGKLLTQLRMGNSAPNVVYFKLAVQGDVVLGGFFGTISTNYFSQLKSARDLAWFIRPGRRGSVAAVMLVADWEAWGHANGAVSFHLGQSTGVQVEATRKLYEKLGYRVVGYNTVKEAIACAADLK